MAPLLTTTGPKAGASMARAHQQQLACCLRRMLSTVAHLSQNWPRHLLVPQAWLPCRRHLHLTGRRTTVTRVMYPQMGTARLRWPAAPARSCATMRCRPSPLLTVEAATAAVGASVVGTPRRLWAACSHHQHHPPSQHRPHLHALVMQVEAVPSSLSWTRLRGGIRTVTATLAEN